MLLELKYILVGKKRKFHFLALTREKIGLTLKIGKSVWTRFLWRRDNFNYSIHSSLYPASTITIVHSWSSFLFESETKQWNEKSGPKNLAEGKYVLRQKLILRPTFWRTIQKEPQNVQ